MIPLLGATLLVTRLTIPPDSVIVPETLVHLVAVSNEASSKSSKNKKVLTPLLVVVWAALL